MAMAAGKRQASGERPKLADITSKRANRGARPIYEFKAHSSSFHEVQATSSDPGLLRVPIGEDNNHGSIENKHLSSLVEKRNDPKRDSQLSVSTNASLTVSTGRKRKTHIGPWLLGKTLGKGATCRVRKAKHELTGQEAAIKIVSRKIAFGHQSGSVLAMDKILAKHPRWAREKRVPFGIEREVVIMKLIEHPHIVRLYDVWENRGEMYLVLELVEGGELFDYIAQNGGMPEYEAIRLFRQLLAGLGHCHRFRLCHRDLKPENILLDNDFNVKIADFGMASMQHTKYLETSCGSPHYAAPEVARGLRYEGEKADIWSIGVVLYVMLTGTVPFGAHIDTNDLETREERVRMILDEVVHCDVEIPNFLSEEAEDLLLHLLLKDPNQRPPMEWIWEHPLLHKHDHRLKHPQGVGKWYEGPEPELTEVDCGPALSDVSEIDPDIVGSLCILWHTTDEDGIIKALLSKNNNYEQVFYHRLLRYRNEQEENFQGPGVETSASDSHHVGKTRLRRSATRTLMAVASQRRQRSQFSIAGSNGRKQSSTTKRSVSEAGTDRSYDPFRASRDQMPTRQADSAKITVLHSSPPPVNESIHVLDSSRLNSHIAPIQGLAFHTNSSITTRKNIDGPSSEVCQPKLCRGHSRSSFGSSVRSCVHSQRGRKSASYKRNVIFTSRQRGSGGVSAPSARSIALSMLSAQQQQSRGSWQTMTSFPATSIIEAVNHTHSIKSRKEVTDEIYHISKGSESNRYSAYLTEEARNVSRELGNYCDHAFQESSIDLSTGSDPRANILSKSSQNASLLEERTKVEPPPRKSSIYHASNKNVTYRQPKPYQRPLPNTPVAESSINPAVEKLLQAQAALVAEAASMPPEELKVSLAALNRMIHAAREDQKRENMRRITSAPPTIRTATSSFEPALEATESVRYFSEPTPHNFNSKVESRGYGWGPGNTTIRVVNDSNMKPAPLTVRKKASTTSINSTYSQQNAQVDQNVSHSKLNMRSYVGNWDHNSYYGGHDQLDTGLETITEDDKEINTYPWSRRGSKDGKLRSLFRRSGSSKSTDSDCGPPPPAKDQPLVPTLYGVQARPTPNGIPIDEISDDLKFQNVPPERLSRKRGFFSFWGWTSSKNKHGLTMFQETNASSGALSSNLSTSSRELDMRNKSTTNVSGTKTVKFDEPTLVRQVTSEPQNWFSKFLRVKPAKYVMALEMNQIMALKEIRGILKDWRRHGMRDVVADRAVGKIWARVDVENSLRIKPVAISIEFFTVLQRGRKHNLCVARFCQEQGARTSFDKVVQTMKDVLRGRERIVADKKKRREMRKCLRDWESN